jgi:hypothetical protein
MYEKDLTHSLRQQLRWFEQGLPTAEFLAESSLVDEATRDERRQHLQSLRRAILEIRAELQRRLDTVGES